jgi:hypothetical protein
MYDWKDKQKKSGRAEGRTQKKSTQDTERRALVNTVTNFRADLLADYHLVKDSALYRQ